jgi:hypothetical protein
LRERRTGYRWRQSPCVACAVTVSCARCSPRGSASVFWRSSMTNQPVRPTDIGSRTVPVVANSSDCLCSIEQTDPGKRTRPGSGRSYPGRLLTASSILKACRRSRSLSVRSQSRSMVSSVPSAASTCGLNSIRAARAADAIWSEGCRCRPSTVSANNAATSSTFCCSTRSRPTLPTISQPGRAWHIPQMSYFSLVQMS